MTDTLPKSDLDRVTHDTHPITIREFNQYFSAFEKWHGIEPTYDNMLWYRFLRVDERLAALNFVLGIEAQKSLSPGEQRVADLLDQAHKTVEADVLFSTADDIAEFNQGINRLKTLIYAQPTRRRLTDD